MKGICGDVHYFHSSFLFSFRFLSFFVCEVGWEKHCQSTARTVSLSRLNDWNDGKWSGSLLCIVSLISFLAARPEMLLIISKYKQLWKTVIITWVNKFKRVCNNNNSFFFSFFLFFFFGQGGARQWLSHKTREEKHGDRLFASRCDSEKSNCVRSDTGTSTHSGSYAHWYKKGGEILIDNPFLRYICFGHFTLQQFSERFFFHWSLSKSQSL